MQGKSLLIYESYEEEGMRRKEGQEEHNGRGSSHWLVEHKNPHPQSYLGFLDRRPQSSPRLHRTLETIHETLELRLSSNLHNS